MFFKLNAADPSKEPCLLGSQISRRERRGGVLAPRRAWAQAEDARSSRLISYPAYFVMTLNTETHFFNTRFPRAPPTLRCTSHTPKRKQYSVKGPGASASEVCGYVSRRRPRRGAPETCGELESPLQISISYKRKASRGLAPKGLGTGAYPHPTGEKECPKNLRRARVSTSDQIQMCS